MGTVTPRRKLQDIFAVTNVNVRGWVNVFKSCPPHTVLPLAAGTTAAMIWVYFLNFVYFYLLKLKQFGVLSSIDIVNPHWASLLKFVQVMVHLRFSPIFSFLAKMLSFLSRNDNIFARNENIGKICKRSITWTDFSFRTSFHQLFCFYKAASWIFLVQKKSSYESRSV